MALQAYSKVGHQVASLHCHILPWIALLALSVSIELVSWSARVTSVKSYKRLGVCLFVCDGHPDPKIGPQVYLGPIKIASPTFGNGNRNEKSHSRYLVTGTEMRILGVGMRHWYSLEWSGTLNKNSLICNFAGEGAYWIPNFVQNVVLSFSKESWFQKCIISMLAFGSNLW